MYTHHFNLKQSPFSIAPDPRYLFMSERHREALAHLLYGVGSGGGFVLLTGEIGAGKTTVCRCFLEQMPENCRLAYIISPKLSVGSLLLAICEEFRIEPALPGVKPTTKSCVDAINAYLLSCHAQSLNNLLIIDEAQNLAPDVLEQLRLLTNLETNERKLLQIILIGQPELRTMLARPELEQLAQRVIARYHLGPLTEAETGSYIAHRLAVAGTTEQPFPQRLLKQIYKLSKGVPRRINLLCDRALLGAYVENRREVSRAILGKAAEEVFCLGTGDASPRPARISGGRLFASVGAIAGVLLGALGAWLYLPRLSPNALPTASAAGPASMSPESKSMPGPEVKPAIPIAPAPATAGAPVTAANYGSAEALRELASLWNISLAAGQGCDAAARLNLRCYQGKGGIDELRRLDRPALLGLQDNPALPRSFAVLTALDGRGATLRVRGTTQVMSLDALAASFDGSFTTFWRTPRGWRDEVGVGDSGPDVDWVAKRLAQLNNLPLPAENTALDASTQVLLQKFQVSQKLAADGVAGPKTFMRLIQQAGGAEPRLLGTGALPSTVAGK
jgi:general secretion pathway protein A